MRTGTARGQSHGTAVGRAARKETRARKAARVFACGRRVPLGTAPAVVCCHLRLRGTKGRYRSDAEVHAEIRLLVLVVPSRRLRWVGSCRCELALARPQYGRSCRAIRGNRQRVVRRRRAGALGDVVRAYSTKPWLCCGIWLLVRVTVLTPKVCIQHRRRQPRPVALSQPARPA